MDDDEKIENENALVRFYRNNRLLVYILLIVIAVILIMKFVVNTDSNGGNGEISVELTTGSIVSVDNTISLKAVVDVDNVTISWTSSDTNIATVFDGVVRGISPGLVKITASYIDSNGNKHVSEPIEISVIEGDSSVAVNNISFPNGSLFMPINAEYQLNLAIDPADAKINRKLFASSNESVAVVSESGVVKAISGGHATIVATVNNQHRATITVYVSNDYNKTEIVISPTTLSFDIGSRKIKVGASEKLSYTMTPSDADSSRIKWTSSDESVVTVDQNGNITGKKEGKAIISITSMNGKRDDVTIEVFNEVIAVTSIDVTTDVINMEAGKTEVITPVVLPQNASNKELIYSSENPSIVSVAVENSGASATLSALQSGSTTITIRSGNVEKKITVNVTGNSNNNQIDDGGNNLPTTIKVTSNKNNLAKSIDEARKIPVPGATTVYIALSQGVGKVKYCINEYGDEPCTPNIELYSSGNVVIPNGGIYILRVVKYDYQDNEIPSTSENYYGKELLYYINTLSSEQTKLYTISNAYTTSGVAVLNSGKVGDKVGVKVNDASRYLYICATVNTTCTPSIRVNDSYTITLDKAGTWSIFVVEYNNSGQKIGNTEVYYANVRVSTSEAKVKVSNLKVNHDSTNGKYLSADVESDLVFTMTRFCYTTVNKNASGTCNLDRTSTTVPLYGNEAIIRLPEAMKTYYSKVTSTTKKTFNFYISELDNIYNTSNINKDVIFEFAVKTSNGYSNPIRLRINMTSRDGNKSNWSVKEA